MRRGPAPGQYSLSFGDPTTPRETVIVVPPVPSLQRLVEGRQHVFDFSGQRPKQDQTMIRACSKCLWVAERGETRCPDGDCHGGRIVEMSHDQHKRLVEETRVP